MHLLKRLEARWSHQPQGVTFTVRVHATDISWAGIKQPWTAVSVVLGLISFAAVFRDVTQRSPVPFGGALRDTPKDGCEGDYVRPSRQRDRPYLLR